MDINKTQYDQKSCCARLIVGVNFQLSPTRTNCDVFPKYRLIMY